MKRLVICCDGTWNTPDAAEDGKLRVTNVVKMARAVAPEDEAKVPQVVYYDDGVGTGGLLDRLVGGATGRGLERNVEEAYRFLVWNYAPGDEIHLFGFSRGAYTARSLAGMIRKCGILRKDHELPLRSAWEFYRSDVHPADPRAAQFRRERSVEPDTRVRLVGVWDTVGARGIPGGLAWLTAWRYRFHDVELSSSIDRAYHALAIDEQRRAFSPSVWRAKDVPGQVVEQVWFAGAHCDVGGGYAEDEDGASDVAFLWMADRAREAGLALNEQYLKERIEPSPTAPLHDARTGLYRFLPARERRIGYVESEAGALLEDRTQSVHPSVLARHAEPGQRYAPPNLVEYLGRMGGR